MEFNIFSVLNRRRCESKRGFNHPLNGWSTSDWITATLGELGEAANIVKKLNRARDGVPGNGETTSEQLKANLADELADTFIYLDLLSQSLGINLEEAVVRKFQKTSEKIGYVDTVFRPLFAAPEKLPVGFGLHHAGEVLDLTGRTWIHCVFKNCTLRLHSYDGSSLIIGAVMLDCRLEGDGWAQFSHGLCFGEKPIAAPKEGE